MDIDRARKIAKMRAAGYSQADIADELGISQQTVSRYLRGIHDAAEGSDDFEAFMLGLVLGGIGVALLLKLLGGNQQGGER